MTWNIFSIRTDTTTGGAGLSLAFSESAAQQTLEQIESEREIEP
jgi:hypothetical protein